MAVWKEKSKVVAADIGRISGMLCRAIYIGETRHMK